MCDERVWPNTTSYSAVISACEKGKHWELALEMLEECKAETIVDTTTDCILHSAAVSACEKGAEWQRVLTRARRPPLPFCRGGGVI